jgi:uncharacterized protein (TIGR02145 family)
MKRKIWIYLLTFLCLIIIGFFVIKDFTIKPVVETLNVTSITPTTAVCNGKFIKNGFFFGNPGKVVCGFCWGTTVNPDVIKNKKIICSFMQFFKGTLTGLTPSTEYHVRAFAANKFGVSYGLDKTFKTQDAVTDYDGNIYPVITIGTQTWMAENLRTTHYRNGDPISYVVYYFDPQNYPWEAYANYNDNPANAIKYGRLYISATMLDSRSICPVGWHIPSEAEWNTLINYLGGESIAGGKLKEAGTTNWMSPNAGAVNSVGFSALPGGCRNQGASYIQLGYNAYFWSSTLSSIGWAKAVMLTSTDENIFWRGINTEFYSVRCIKD